MSCSAWGSTRKSFDSHVVRPSAQKHMTSPYRPKLWNGSQWVSQSQVLGSHKGGAAGINSHNDWKCTLKHLDDSFMPRPDLLGQHELFPVAESGLHPCWELGSKHAGWRLNSNHQWLLDTWLTRRWFWRQGGHWDLQLVSKIVYNTCGQDYETSAWVPQQGSEIYYSAAAPSEGIHLRSKPPQPHEVLLAELAVYAAAEQSEQPPSHAQADLQHLEPPELSELLADAGDPQQSGLMDLQQLELPDLSELACPDYAQQFDLLDLPELSELLEPPSKRVRVDSFTDMLFQ